MQRRFSLQHGDVVKLTCPPADVRVVYPTPPEYGLVDVLQKYMIDTIWQLNWTSEIDHNRGVNASVLLFISIWQRPVSKFMFALFVRCSGGVILERRVGDYHS